MRLSQTYVLEHDGPFGIGSSNLWKWCLCHGDDDDDVDDDDDDDDGDDHGDDDDDGDGDDDDDDDGDGDGDSDGDKGRISRRCRQTRLLCSSPHYYMQLAPMGRHFTR